MVESWQLTLLSQQCSEFLTQARNIPLIKSLSSSDECFRKIKIRQNKKLTHPILNKAFSKIFNINDFGSRALFVNEPNIPDSNTITPHYIFPINGFAYTYSVNIHNSNDELKPVFDVLLQMSNAENLIIDVIDMLYNNEHKSLFDGMTLGVEIIIYKIPYFYAIPTQCISYEDIINWHTHNENRI